MINFFIMTIKKRPTGFRRVSCITNRNKSVFNPNVSFSCFVSLWFFWLHFKLAQLLILPANCSNFRAAVGRPKLQVRTIAQVSRIYSAVLAPLPSAPSQMHKWDCFSQTHASHFCRVVSVVNMPTVRARHSVCLAKIGWLAASSLIFLHRISFSSLIDEKQIRSNVRTKQAPAGLSSLVAGLWFSSIKTALNRPAARSFQYLEWVIRVFLDDHSICALLIDCSNVVPSLDWVWSSHVLNRSICRPTGFQSAI